VRLYINQLDLPLQSDLAHHLGILIPRWNHEILG
jgi:hypothetical protein